MTGASGAAFGASLCNPGGACGVPLNAPTGGEATSDHTEHVDLSWAPVAGATGYVVRRDGDEIARVTSTTYRDAGATASPPPPMPASLVASTSRSDGIQLTWTTPVDPTPGPLHAYSVAMLDGDREGPESEWFTGQRAAHPVIGYSVQVGGAPWLAIGTSNSFLDTSAPLGTIAGATVTATDGTYHAYVRASCSATTSGGPLTEYSVRAYSLAGDGPARTASGRRSVGTLSYTWKRSSSTTDGSYTTVSSSTASSFDDTGAPSSGAPRFYRCAVSSPTAFNSVESAGESGYRASCGDRIRNGDETAIDCGGSCPAC